MPDLKLMDLIKDIERGDIKIPQFQRDFVWRKEKAAKLLDSIIRGYPIGSFIFWMTIEPLRSVRNIGNITLPPPREGYQTLYILDGQQRITSMFAAIKGCKVEHPNSSENFSTICINLRNSLDEDIVVSERDDNHPDDFIELSILLKGSLTELIKYKEEYHHKISNYKRAIETYSIPTVTINDLKMDVAAEIFTRINVGGKPLTLFEIMVAKTFDQDKNFDLARKFDEFTAKLKIVNFGGLPDSVFLKCISVLLIHECKARQILNLDKSKIIDNFHITLTAIRRAIDYIRASLNVPVLELLPYPDIVVIFTYFFANYDGNPDYTMGRRLEDLFWRISLTGRYSSATESKIAQDIKQIQRIIKNEETEYRFSPMPYIQPQYIKQNGGFKLGSSFIKSILCLFIRQQPKSFFDNKNIFIGDGFLDKRNQSNFHHFFPTAYMKREQKDNSLEVNHIANITIIDDFLNKRIIKDKAPSEYILKFSHNILLKETLETHLIDFKNDGIETNDYDKFYENRINRISNLFEASIIKHQIDNPNQTTALSLFYLKKPNKGIDAKGILLGKGIKILRGSTASLDKTASLSKSDSEIRASLIKNGALLEVDGVYVFQIDFPFKSTSSAASVISGTSQSGPDNWTDFMGVKLKDIH